MTPDPARDPGTPVSLPEQLLRCARSTPDAIYLIEVDGRTLTYREVLEESLRWAFAFRRVGVCPSERVATILPNSVDSFLVWVGLCWLKAWEVPVSAEYRGGILEHTLGSSEASLLVTTRGSLEAVEPLLHRLPQLSRVVLLDGEEELDGVEVVSGDAFLSGARVEESPEPPRPWDVASILYTSGTTGLSKGVLVMWGQVHATALATLPLDDIGSQDRFYSFGAPNHIGAKSLPLTMAMAGGSLVLRNGFSTAAFWRDVDAHGCTTVGLLGAMTHFLMDAPESPDDKRHALRNVLMAPVHPQVVQFSQRFGVRVCTAYNMTEISVPVRYRGWDVEVAASCGHLRSGYPGYEVRLVDEHDQEVEDGSVGEMIVRTSVPWTLNGGYFGMPEATATAWRNGWFHTGDAFRRDERGRYYFTDRMKDTIRRRGENILSLEVEIELNAHEAVLESAAVAVPSDSAEDEIMVFVRLTPGEQLRFEELIRFLEPRMARYMIPRYFEVVDDFPRTHTQRIRKTELRSRGVGPATWDRFGPERRQTFD